MTELPEQAPALRLGRAGWLHSIHGKLSSIMFSFFVLVVALGSFGIERLNDFNHISADVSGVWLPKTSLLGDLNNYTSDFRAEEGELLLMTKPAEFTRIENEMRVLDETIAQASKNFALTRHSQDEIMLYENFVRRWREYRSLTDKVLAYVRDDRQPDARALYATSSRAAYTAASDTLGQLTQSNLIAAQYASRLVNEVYEQARWTIWTAIFLAAAMIATAMLYVRHSISRPLLELASAMNRLSRNETNIDFKESRRRDEIGVMTNAATIFRQNAIELMRNQQALAQESSMLEEKLSHERNLTVTQRNFISMISHEFRTPLTIIDGHARRLIKSSNEARTEDITERAGKIRVATARLNHMIDSLLDSSRLLESGAELYFHPARTDPATLLHDVCQLQRDIMPEVNIVEAISGLHGEIMADPKLLAQAIGNLLGNAIKFSPHDGIITVSAIEQAHQLIISVADQGLGIPEKDMRQLFDRYFRASNVSGIIGTGIGLYLVKMVIDLHGGSIAVDSREGHGSTFTVRLPLAS